MNDTHALIRAAAETGEKTPLAMLADNLLESNDLRGLVLKKWLDGEYGSDWIGDQPVTHSQTFGTGRTQAAIRTTIGRGYPVKNAVGNLEEDAGYSTPVVALSIHSGPVGYGQRKSLTHYVRMKHEDVRRLADQLGDKAKAAHSFLDTHFGTDPRFVDDLSKALKPDADGDQK